MKETERVGTEEGHWMCELTFLNSDGEHRLHRRLVGAGLCVEKKADTRAR